jgi:hypothetical protein
MDVADQGEVDHSLAVVGRCDSQVSLIKHNTAKGLHSRKPVSVGPKLLCAGSFDGHKYQGGVLLFARPPYQVIDPQFSNTAKEIPTERHKWQDQDRYPRVREDAGQHEQQALPFASSHDNHHLLSP